MTAIGVTELFRDTLIACGDPPDTPVTVAEDADPSLLFASSGEPSSTFSEGVGATAANSSRLTLHFFFGAVFSGPGEPPAVGFRPGRGLGGSTHFLDVFMRLSLLRIEEDFAVWLYVGLNVDLGVEAGFGLMAIAGWILAYLVEAWGWGVAAGVPL